LNSIGDEYYNYRACLMIEHGEGITKTYNRFHDPYEKSPEIVKLRELHAAMDDAVLRAYACDDLADRAAQPALCQFPVDRVDDAVLRAYGWDDLADRAAQPDFCQFLLDYEEEEEEGAGGQGSGARKKKKPWRYRWPDDFRDEVLARLLELNAERHREEMLAGA